MNFFYVYIIIFSFFHCLFRFDEERAKFYAAELVLGLEAMHNLSILHLDIKVMFCFVFKFLFHKEYWSMC